MGGENKEQFGFSPRALRSSYRCEELGFFIPGNVNRYTDSLLQARHRANREFKIFHSSKSIDTFVYRRSIGRLGNNLCKELSVGDRENAPCLVELCPQAVTVCQRRHWWAE